MDSKSQKYAVDFMIDAGSDGLCILANFSEQFSLSDEERETLTFQILHHVDGRVPVIVTTTHFSSAVCAVRSKQAQDLGASMVMVMPPYHGATIRAPEEEIFEFYKIISDSIQIPVMVQDAPVAGTSLSVPFLVRLAKEIENLSYFKIEVPQAAAKLRSLIEAGGEAVIGPWDGEEAITLMADLDAGATGAMTGGGYPDGIKQIFVPYAKGDRKTAMQAYQQWLPLINWENRQCGIQASKILMKEGGIIGSDKMRHPLRGVHPKAKEGLVELAKAVDALVLRWRR